MRGKHVSWGVLALCLVQTALAKDTGAGAKSKGFLAALWLFAWQLRGLDGHYAAYCCMSAGF
jgi:hypothetical protein